MLVSNNVYKNRYVYDGAQFNFPISFPFLDEKHIQVRYAKRGQEDTDSHIMNSRYYMITGVGNPAGGVLTRLSNWEPGIVIVIMRDVPITQLHQYTQYDNFPAESHEDALAKLTMICQELDEICSRAITVPATSKKTPQEWWKAIYNEIMHARDQILAGLTLAGNVTGATMVVADGTTTPRSISDRLADIVNVKDFGAKGDGVTDDTEAFNTATLKGMTFVPSGTYKVTEWVVGDFYSDGKVLIVGGGFVPIESSNSKKENKLSKDLVCVLPHKFDDYDSLKASFNLTHTNGLQQIAVDKEDKRIYCFYFFGLDTISNKQISVVAIYDFHRSYIGYNVLRSTNSTESFCIGTYNNQKAAFFRDTIRNIYVYRLDSFNGDGNEVIHIHQIPTNVNIADILTVDDDSVYAPTNGAASGTFFEAFPIYRYDFSGNCLGLIQTDWQSSGPKYQSSANGLNPGILKKFPKAQNLTKTPDGFIYVNGSDYPNTSQTLSSIPQLRYIRNDGTTKYVINLNPKKFLKLLIDKGLDAIELEYEGVCYADGDVYSAIRYNGKSHTEGIAIFRELSDSAVSIDMSDVIDMPSILNVERLSLGRFPSPVSTAINPITGKQINTLYEVLEFMATCQIPHISFYVDQSGITLPQNMAVNGVSPFVEVKNISNLLFNVRITTNTYITNYRVICKVAEGEAQVEYKEVTQTSTGLLMDADGINAITPNIRFMYRGDASHTFTGIRGAFTGTNGDGLNLAYGGVNKGTDQYQTVGLHEFFTRAENEAKTASQRTVAIAKNALYPGVDNTVTLGNGKYKFSQLYAATGNIITSDIRTKQHINDIPEMVFIAWGKVNFKQFMFNDAVKKKGASARLHVGVIAQQIKEAFEAEGLDATRYGIICYDEWRDEWESVEVMDNPVLDEDGNEIVPAQMHTERVQTQTAGSQYGIRYEEALVLECAYQRWLGEKRDAKIAALEEKLNSVLS